MNATPSPPVRAELMLDGRRLSYLDFGGNGRLLLALHGHLDEGRTFSRLARDLAPDWRVVAPDQRGHGDSDRAPQYTRQGYVDDVAALIEHLAAGPAVVLGHSLGGLNAYQTAAWHPHLVSALVVEDAGAEMGVSGGANPFLFLSGCPYRADTPEQLTAALGAAGPMFADALRQLPDGSWRLPFHPQDTIDSYADNEGDHWADWQASDCPALLLYGARSPVVGPARAQVMVRRRPGTEAVELDADHFLHRDRPLEFARAVRLFLGA
ncbi:alpha/beta fold hydrolase [Streptomyces rimosus]|uniref:alpha/beta fold hydrolase n=1 Tax=Streptomyces rimosus TaxID=1927 RepID=UPI001F3CC869|nr:alpha/beta hydrolase [Streptomyces rimosus]